MQSWSENSAQARITLCLSSRLQHPRWQMDSKYWCNIYYIHCRKKACVRKKTRLRLWDLCVQGWHHGQSWHSASCPRWLLSHLTTNETFLAGNIKCNQKRFWLLVSFQLLLAASDFFVPVTFTFMWMTKYIRTHFRQDVWLQSCTSPISFSEMSILRSRRVSTETQTGHSAVSMKSFFPKQLLLYWWISVESYMVWTQFCALYLWAGRECQFCQGQVTSVAWTHFWAVWLFISLDSPWWLWDKKLWIKKIFFALIAPQNTHAQDVWLHHVFSSISFVVGYFQKKTNKKVLKLQLYLAHRCWNGWVISECFVWMRDFKENTNV